MMESRGMIFCVILAACMMAPACSESFKKDNNKVDLENYDYGSICSLPAVGKILREIGIGRSTRCLMKNKRDLASLVSTYLNRGKTNNGWVNYRRSHIESKRDFYRELEDLLDYNQRTKRASYCCSPQCNPFMATLGNPDSNLISCE